MRVCYPTGMVSSFFTHPGFVFGAAAGLSWLAHRLRAPHALFLLVFGAILGRDGLGVWVDLASLDGFVAVGIASLLFLVGLELSPSFFREVGARPVRVFLASLLAVGGLGVVWASSFAVPMVLAVLVGALFAFNSTMLTLKALGDREELGKAHGRVVTSVLILQDVAASLLLVCVAVFEALSHDAAWTTVAATYLGKVVLLGLACWVFAKYLLARVWRQIAKRHEVFVLAGFAYPLFVGALFSLLGLSVELGALVAGLSLAHSEYRFELMTRMRPLKEIFLAPFFLAIGAGWAWRSLATLWPEVLVGLLLVCVLGPLVVAFVMRRSGYPRLTALATSLHLAQGSEFSFLFLTVAAVPLVIPGALQAALLSVVILSMIVGSLVMQVAPRLLALARQGWPERPAGHDGTFPRSESLLFGCHRVGADFLPVLKRSSRSFTVVDMDPQVVERLQGQGYQAVFGDMGNRDLLEKIGLARAKLVISTVPDVEAQVMLLKQLKRHRAKPIVILVAHQVEEALLLYKQGATYVILPHFLGGNYASQLIEVHGYEDPEPFEVERLRHVEHLKRRGQALLAVPAKVKRTR